MSMLGLSRTRATREMGIARREWESESGRKQE